MRSESTSTAASSSNWLAFRLRSLITPRLLAVPQIVPRFLAVPLILAISLILVIPLLPPTISTMRAATAGERLGSAVRPWPTTATVLKEFDPPWPDWLPGHRGLDLLGHDGGPVRTPKSGVVAWKGRVGGTPVVVIRHGVARATYQPVSNGLPVGTRVASGQVIGSLAPGGHCREDCLHWGLKVDGRYLDPRTLLQPLQPVLVKDSHRS